MDLVTAIKERRSIRSFRSDEVPRELLEEVVATALWAPSGMNRQDWEIFVVRGAKKDALMEVISRSQDYVLPHLQGLFPQKIIRISLQVFKNLGGAPVLFLVYIPKELVHLDEAMGDRARFHAEFRRHARLLSAAALIQNLLLAAHALGLGTCWMTGPKYMEPEINALLGITDKELVSLIPLGYPDQAPPVPPRRGNVVHWVGM